MADGNGKKWDVQTWISLLTFIAVVIGFVFGLGVQWAKTTAVEASVAAINAAFDRGVYVRSDLYDKDQQALSKSIDDLTETIRLVVAADPPRPPKIVTGRSVQ